MNDRTIERPPITAAQRRLLLRARDAADFFDREGLGSGTVYVEGAERVTARRLETFGELRRVRDFQSYVITLCGRARVPPNGATPRPARAPIDDLAVTLARWIATDRDVRRWLIRVQRGCTRVLPDTEQARAESACADLLEALEAVIAAAPARP